jgi:hypothetical protein
MQVDFEGSIREVSRCRLKPLGCSHSNDSSLKKALVVTQFLSPTPVVENISIQAKVLGVQSSPIFY